MDAIKIEWLEMINEREAELILAIVGAAKCFWENGPPLWLTGNNFSIGDIESLQSKLLSFRMWVADERRVK